MYILIVNVAFMHIKIFKQSSCKQLPLAYLRTLCPQKKKIVMIREIVKIREVLNILTVMAVF